jgi:hypothetical protein
MVCLALATPVAKTCDAGGGALRSQRRGWPAGGNVFQSLARAEERSYFHEARMIPSVVLVRIFTAAYNPKVSHSRQRDAELPRKAILVQPKQPRARRYSFVAPIELTDMQSEVQLREQTSDLSLFGCHVETSKFLPTGTKVRIRIVHRGANFTALGRVVYVRPCKGIGVVFTLSEPNEQAVLERWIAEVRAQ